MRLFERLKNVVGDRCAVDKARKTAISLRLGAFLLSICCLSQSTLGNTLPCLLIDISGSFKVKIFNDIFADFPHFADRYFHDDFVQFTRMLSSSTQQLQFGSTLVEAQNNVRITQNERHRVVSEPPFQSGQIFASVVKGSRTCLLRIEILTAVQETSDDRQRTPFQLEIEEYPILGLSFKKGYSIWLGLPNTNEMVSYFRLDRIE
ncbi:MAG: hypothetical protein NZ480_03210 [Bdellovibrionaceae bacterium]|nr:hypothetical protein [Pseudobdellovibrionaceae bacterium]MDW8189918.1 hypothetical protein [Pseudobdellovibrionaceae bacterium]